MCGICGVVSSQALPPVANRWLGAMTSALVHRGPDDEGHFVASHAALGMRRLSIVDVAGGQQPIANEDGTLHIVANGEIYNHLELRADLESRGHRFRTRSDIEVALHAYEEFGTDAPRHLDGMFAFAIWDDTAKRLFAARDRFGQKPLHYAQHGSMLSFASELGALLQVPSIERQIDERSLDHYLSLQYVPEPRSIYRKVAKLPAAHWLSFQGGRLRIERYWQLRYEPKLQLDEPEAIAEVQRLLRRAVERRLMGEVPVGAFLSGGLDSSIIVALMAELAPGKVATFSIGFDVESVNELPYARQIADLFATEHHDWIVTPQRFDDLLPRLVDAFDEPFADASAFQTYSLAEATRRHVTVALNGDGGDEMFAGYPRYWLDRLVRPYCRLPRSVTQKLIPALVAHLPEPRQAAIEANWPLGLKRLAQVARVTPKASILRWGSHFDAELKEQIYLPEMRQRLAEQANADLAAAEQQLAETFDRAPARTLLDRTLAVDVDHYLAGDLLVKTDRLTMAHSLEARSPFLDHHLAEFAARLPTSLKLRGRTGKYLLRRAFAHLLPKQIVRRAKRGFGAPLESWLRQELRPAMHELLLSPDARLTTWISRQAIASMVDQHERAQVDHGRRIWTLLMLEAWLRQDNAVPVTATELMT